MGGRQRERLGDLGLEEWIKAGTGALKASLETETKAKAEVGRAAQWGSPRLVACLESARFDLQH